jgi:diacylglycerol kinase family enzyme
MRTATGRSRGAHRLRPVNAALIVNPYATRVTEERIEQVLAELSRAAAFETLVTERPLHATELVREAVADGAEAIVVFSGDGGFNEAINGLGADVPIGFVPGGGTSVLPRALGLPRDPLAAARRLADAIVAGRTRRISLGRINGRRFTFSAGIGFDAEAVRRMDARGRSDDGRRPGDMVFVATVLRMLLERRGHSEPELEIRGLGRAAFALVTNGDPFTYAGNHPIHVAPEASFELGLDVVGPTRLRRRALPRLVRYAAAGGRPPRDLLHGHDLDRFEVVCDRPLPAQADGEDLGDVTEAVFEAERGAVSVLV